MASLSRGNEAARENLSSEAAFTSDDLNYPFASGTFRWVAKGKYTNGPRKGEKCVCKWFKSGVVYEDAYYEKDVKAIEKAIDIVREFNNSGLIEEHVQLNKADVWTFREGSKWDGHKVLQEPFIRRWQKFNSNTGWVNGKEGWAEKMQALSHFSYHISQGHYLLCDLQGGVTETGIVLTDPVILSRSKSYGVTDLGPSGISTFFARHKCSQYCRVFWQKPNDQRIFFDAMEGTSMVSGSRSRHSKAINSKSRCLKVRNSNNSHNLRSRSTHSMKSSDISSTKKSHHTDSDSDDD